jgi:undecaprenyl-diphosphatase
VRHPDRPDSAAQRADQHLLTALRRCGADPYVARAAKGLSWTGEHGAVWLAAGLAGAAADPDRRGGWLRATALVAGAHAASMAVKRVVRRPRPELPGAAPLVRTAGRHSFPSSHATSAAAAVVAFGALLPRGAVPRTVPLLAADLVPSVVPRLAADLVRSMVPQLVPPLAAAMCVSRLVVGVHYPTDVACGALLGGAVARLGRRWALTGVRDD